jgi:hypothetical protein
MAVAAQQRAKLTLPYVCRAVASDPYLLYNTWVRQTDTDHTYVCTTQYIINQAPGYTIQRVKLEQELARPRPRDTQAKTASDIIYLATRVQI